MQTIDIFRGALCVLALTAAVSSKALADEGGVELVSGGRINGNIMAVLPGERVAIRLADGTAVEVAWADVRRVIDGPRVYQGPSEAQITQPAAPVIAPPAQGVTVVPEAPLVPEVRIEEDDPPPIRAPYATRLVPPLQGPTNGYPTRMATSPEATRYMLVYNALPRRGGTVWLFIGSGVFAMNGMAMAATGSAFSCNNDFDAYGDYEYDDCGFRRGMIAGGVLSAGIGVFMFVRAIKRIHTRRRGMRQLMGLPSVAGSNEGTRLALDAQVDHARFVPRLSLTF